MSWKSFIREYARPIAKGAASPLDLPFALYNLGALGYNKFFNSNAGYAPYPSELVGAGVDYLAGTRGEQKVSPGSRAIEFAMGMLGGGYAARGLKYLAPASKAKLIDKAAPWALGSTKGRDIGVAAGMGAVTQMAEDAGASPLTAAGAGIAAGAAGTAGIAGIKRSSRKILEKPVLKNFDHKAFDAAVRQGLVDNMPRSVFDRSTLTRAVDVASQYFPASANTFRKQYQRGTKAIYDRLETLLDLHTDTIKEGVELTTCKPKVNLKRFNADYVKPSHTAKLLEHEIKHYKDLSPDIITPERARNFEEMVESMQNWLSLYTRKDGKVPVDVLKQKFHDIERRARWPQTDADKTEIWLDGFLERVSEGLLHDLGRKTPYKHPSWDPVKTHASNRLPTDPVMSGFYPSGMSYAQMKRAFRERKIRQAYLGMSQGEDKFTPEKFLKGYQDSEKRRISDAMFFEWEDYQPALKDISDLANNYPAASLASMKQSAILPIVEKVVDKTPLRVSSLAGFLLSSFLESQSTNRLLGKYVKGMSGTPKQKRRIERLVQQKTKKDAGDLKTVINTTARESRDSHEDLGSIFKKMRKMGK